MRVAVHFPDGHEFAPGGAAVVAYRLGRIEEGVHNAPVGLDPVPLGVFLGRLLEQAQAEFPGAEVRIERLVDNGDGTSRWIPAEEFDPAQHTPAGFGQTVSRDVAADLSPQGGSA